MAEPKTRLARVDPVWDEITADAHQAVRDEPVMGGLIHACILHHKSLDRALSYRFAAKLSSNEMSMVILREIADETLSLIRRGDENVRKQSYYQRIEQMQQQLAQYLAREDSIDKADLADAQQLLERWRAADDRITAYIAVGNYQAATQVALGTGEDDSTPAFDKLDEALSQGIEQSRNQLRSDIVNARRVLSGSTVGAAALSVVAAISVALGIWPRLSEYR